MNLHSTYTDAWHLGEQWEHFTTLYLAIILWKETSKNYKYCSNAFVYISLFLHSWTRWDLVNTSITYKYVFVFVSLLFLFFTLKTVTDTNTILFFLLTLFIKILMSSTKYKYIKTNLEFSNMTQLQLPLFKGSGISYNLQSEV